MSTPKKSSKQPTYRKYLPWVLLGLILLIAVFFRFWRLASLPPGLHPDEAANGLDIFRMIDHHDIRILYATNGPREALFFYIQAIFVLLLGNSVVALRIAPAFIGVLAVFATYLWAKDWFGRRVGLLAGFIFAINPWAITVTRDGFRASMTPLMVALTMYFVGRAARTHKRLYFVLAGVAFGLGLYTYTAFLMLAVAGVLSIGWLALVRRDWLKANLANIGLSIGIVILIASPLAYLMIRHPNESPLARASGTSALNSGLNNGSPIKTVFDNTAKTLLQFNWRGDMNSRHNTPGEPVLDAFIGIMFLLGFVLCIIHLNRPKYFTLLAVFGAMLLTGIITAEGIPHGLRTIGSAPAAFIISALGINYILFGWYRTFPVNSPARIVGLSMICALLTLSGIKAYKQYFIAWAQNPRTYEAYSEDSVQMAYYLNDHRNGPAQYVFAGDYTLKPTEYLTHHKSTYTQLDTQKLENLPIDSQPKTILVVNGNATDAQKALDFIKTKFPNAVVTPYNSKATDKILFNVVTINQ